MQQVMALMKMALHMFPFCKNDKSVCCTSSGLNNSGANATLCAWFDYNGNGVFDVSEGLAPITVSSMASYQSFICHGQEYQVLSTMVTILTCA